MKCGDEKQQEQPLYSIPNLTALANLSKTAAEKVNTHNTFRKRALSPSANTDIEDQIRVNRLKELTIGGRVTRDAEVVSEDLEDIFADLVKEHSVMNPSAADLSTFANIAENVIKVHDWDEKLKDYLAVLTELKDVYEYKEIVGLLCNDTDIKIDASDADRPKTNLIRVCNRHVDLRAEWEDLETKVAKSVDRAEKQKSEYQLTCVKLIDHFRSACKKVDDGMDYVQVSEIYLPFMVEQYTLIDQSNCAVQLHSEAERAAADHHEQLASLRMRLEESAEEIGKFVDIVVEDIKLE